METRSKSEELGRPGNKDDQPVSSKSCFTMFEEDPKTLDNTSQKKLPVRENTAKKTEEARSIKQKEDRMKPLDVRPRSLSWPDVGAKWSLDQMAKYNSTSVMDAAPDALSEKNGRSPEIGSGQYRQRLRTWAGQAKSIQEPGLTAFRSDFMVYYLDDAKIAKPYASEIRQPRMRYRPPCICRPEQPPSSVCTTIEEEQAEYEERINYCKLCLTWLAFFAKLALFLAIWLLLLYWFLASAGFINVVPLPVELPKELNTYIDKDQHFKFLVIDNTHESVELEVQYMGPFADSNVFFNCQYERLYYNYNKFNRSDVKRHEAEDVEVDHRIYEDSYSAVTTTWLYTRIRRSTTIISTTITARLTRYNLSRHPMSAFAVKFPYNFVPWNNERYYSYTFANFRGVGGRHYGHRHYANKTGDGELRVIYGLKYSLNMSTKAELDGNADLNSVAFSIQVLKGIDPRYTTTTTTPPPPNVVKSYDAAKYTFILLGLLFALLFLQANRLIAIFTIGVACLSIIAYLHVRPGPDTVVSWLNMDYLFELIFAKLCIAVAMETGIYDLVSVLLYKVTNGFFILFAPLICAATFVLCLVVDNVVAILIMNPICIRTMEEGHLNPTPVLMSMILYANIAGVLDRDYSYFNWVIHKGKEKWEATEGAFAATSYNGMMMPGVGICLILTTLYLAFIFLFSRPQKYYNTPVAEMVHEQLLLRMAASSIHRTSCHWDTVRRDLIEWYHEIERARIRKLANIDNPHPTPQVPFKFNKITDYPLLLKLGCVLFVFLLMIYFRKINMYGLGVSHIGWIIVICFGILLILVNPSDLNILFWRMDWSTIWVFLCLFFLEKTLQTFILHDRLFDRMKEHFPAETVSDYVNQITAQGIQNLLWMSAVMSCLITNFGAVSVLTKLGIYFGNIVMLERIPHMVWAMTFGGNVGGSATVMGTGVAIAASASAWQQGYRMGAWRYIVFCLPITVLNMVVLYIYISVMPY